MNLLPLLLVLLVACGGVAPAEDAGEAGPAPSLELGTGLLAFESVADGATVPLVAGSQGGRHVDVALRLRDIDPVGLTVEYDGFDAATGEVLFTPVQRFLSPTGLVMEDGAWIRAGDRLVVDEPRVSPADLDGRRVRLTASARGRNGERASDTIEVVLRLSSGIDAGVPRPDGGLPLPDGGAGCAAPGSGTPVFTEVAEEVGLFGRYGDPDATPECSDELVGGAVTAADFDGDGDHDLFFPRPRAPDLLFRNDGGTFTEVGADLGLDHVGSSAAAVFFDVEGDGDLDLYVTSGARAPNRLYVNTPEGYLEEGAIRGVDLPLSSPFLCSYQLGVAVGDADHDGDLDLLVAAWEESEGPAVDRTRLLLNDGSGFFTDGTVAAGIDPIGRAAFTPAFGDVDGDGLRDLALAADWGRSRLYRRTASAYVDITTAAAVGTDENGMGSALVDLDGDGDLDWFVTAIGERFWPEGGNRLYANRGDGTFDDVTTAAGVRQGDWGWGVAAIDFDHDGDLDLAMENGSPEAALWMDDVSLLFRNDGDLRFTEVGCEHGFARPGMGKALVPLDLEGDGDLDLVAVRTYGTPLLLRNDGANARPWLRVRLRQPGTRNPRAIGARLTLTSPTSGESQHRDVHLNPGLGGPAPAEAHFGLAEGGRRDLRVTWPDGATQEVPDVTLRSVITVTRDP